MKALKKDPIHKMIMATRDDYVNNNMFDPDEVIAAVVEEKVFAEKAFRRSRRLSRTTNPNTSEPKINYCPE